jgi:hypothetical protein
MGKKWPHHLASNLNLELHNMGEQSCGNGWISRSTIFKTDELLKSGVPPEEILVAVMWSGIDRKGFFISRDETPNYINLALNNHQVGKDRGWLEGSNNVHHTSEPDPRIEYRDQAFQFFPLECLAIESYEHFLRLQWFCDSKNITLVNLTYGDIMRYPNSSFINPRKKDKLTKDTFPDMFHLFNMVDFSKWLFFEDTSGMYEYVVCNNLGLIADRVHPDPTAHRMYVEDFVIPKLKERKLI